MATGKLPFDGESSGDICGAILHAQPAPPSRFNPGISQGLEAVIGKALEKDRNLRYQHASEYFSAIGPWSGLTPDGSPLFVRNLSTDEIYALDLDLP
jgi:hypothetical protein